MKTPKDYLLDSEDEDKDKENGSSEPDENGDKEENEEPIRFHGPLGPLTKEEIEERGFAVKTIKFTPFDLVLVVLSLFLFTVSGCGISFLSLLAVMVSAPLYAVFSYRIGNNFSFFIPLAALVVSGFITKNPLMPLGTLLATAMAYIILYSVNNRREGSKTSAVTGCCIAMGAFIAVSFIVTDLMGKISLRELLSVIDAVFSEMETYAYEMYSGIANAGVDMGITNADISSLAKQFATSARAQLPSVVVISFMIISYISASLLPVISRLCGAKDMLSQTKYEISISKAGVFVYLISWLGSFLGTGIFGYSFRNITTILTPALSLCGVKQIGEFFTAKGMPKIASVLIQAASIFVALLFGNIGLSLLMLFGVFRTFKNPVSGGNT